MLEEIMKQIDPFYSESNMKALNESIQQMRCGQTVTFTLEELEELEEKTKKKD